MNIPSWAVVLARVGAGTNSDLLLEKSSTAPPSPPPRDCTPNHRPTPRTVLLPGERFPCSVRESAWRMGADRRPPNGLPDRARVIVTGAAPVAGFGLLGLANQTPGCLPGLRPRQAITRQAPNPETGPRSRKFAAEALGRVAGTRVRERSIKGPARQTTHERSKGQSSPGAETVRGVVGQGCMPRAAGMEGRTKTSRAVDYCSSQPPTLASTTAQEGSFNASGPAARGMHP